MKVDTFSISALHLAIKVPYFSNSGHKNQKVTSYLRRACAAGWPRCPRSATRYCEQRAHVSSNHAKSRVSVMRGGSAGDALGSPGRVHRSRVAAPSLLRRDASPAPAAARDGALDWGVGAGSNVPIGLDRIFKIFAQYHCLCTQSVCLVVMNMRIVLCYLPVDLI
eukprot:SAG31_NODE_1705_length_7491_cov_3.705222_3_plen_165_part_00